MLAVSKGSFSRFLTLSPLPRSAVPEYLSHIFLCYLRDAKEHKDDSKRKWLRQDQCSDWWSAGAFPDAFACPLRVAQLLKGGSLQCGAFAMLPPGFSSRWIGAWKRKSVFCQLCGNSFSMRMRLSPGRSAKWMWQGAAICICELFLLCGMMI